MTTFYTGSEKPIVLHDDRLGPRLENCTESCWVVTGNPDVMNIDLSVLDSYTDQELKAWFYWLKLRGLDPIEAKPDEFVEGVVPPWREFINNQDINNATTTIYFTRKEAEEALRKAKEKIFELQKQVSNYFRARFRLNEALDGRSFNDYLAFFYDRTLIEIPNCQDVFGDRCKDDDEIIDLSSITICKLDKYQGEIECYKRSKKSVGKYESEVDTCNDCKGYMICCDKGIPRLIIAGASLASDQITNCIYYSDQKEAIEALKEARQVTGYYRELELINGTYLCRKGYEYCNNPLYDDYYECRNITRPPEQLDPPLPPLDQVL